MRLVVALILVAATLLAGATASTPASAPTGAAAAGCTPEYIPHLGQACLRGDGLFDVVLADGTRLRTHGPDPRPSGDDPGYEEGSDEREPVCADEWALHVLYGHPTGTPDRGPAVAEALRAATRRMNALLNADAIASGGPTADYRAVCDESGKISVDSFSGPDASSPAYTAEYGTIVDAAGAAGFDAESIDYIIFWDAGSTVCGVGNLATDDTLSGDNANMMETGYGVVYDGCWFGRTPMHENGHTQGAVQDLAPMWDGSGHCVEGLDVMCYPGEGGFTGTATLGLVEQCSDRIHYDCQYDTYFDAAPEAGEWLATHWNIGSPVNRYIAFADADSPRSGSLAAAAAVNATAESTTPSNTTATSAPPSTASQAPTSSARATTTRVVAAPRTTTGVATTPAPFNDGEPVTIEVPAAGWLLAAAALGGVAGLRRRLR